MKQEFYYQQMNKAQQNAYRAMLDGFESLSPEFPVLRLDGKELSDIFFRLRLDHPAIFYVEGFHYRFAQNSEYVQMIPEYMFEKKKIKEMKTALESRISRLVRQAEGMAPEEKEKYVHDFICSNVTYDKLKKQYSHEIIGPLQQGIGVCEGIAKTVKILCDRMGLECLIAISESAPDRGIRYRHAWNLVKLKNTWYHLDATFDNSLGRYGQKRFDYFNLDDANISRDHFDFNMSFECTSMLYNYHAIMGRFISGKKQLIQLLSDGLALGKNFSFRIKRTINTPDNIDDIVVETFNESVKYNGTNGKQYYLSANKSQLTYYVTVG